MYKSFVKTAIALGVLFTVNVAMADYPPKGKTCPPGTHWTKDHMSGPWYCGVPRKSTPTKTQSE
ncbi:hypothetical protein [Celerinatantimonas sp. YJH-8]|uniref:hypothetical protein n=1 Tax=Celerinatantimonas sp. YJH-8 TaxID=3228714 RepID=UPI0038C6A64F